MKKAIVVMAVALLAGCGDDPPPQQIKDISTRIHSVVEDGAVLRIEISARPALNAESHFQNASMDTAGISEKLIKYFPNTKQDELIYVLYADVVDKYGKKSEEPVLELQYKMDDMRKVDFVNLYHKQILELAEPIRYLSMAGTQIVKAWCKDEANRSDARNFCAKNT